MKENEKLDRNKPEKTNLKIGFIPLTDCCVLAVAKEKGLFEDAGLDVELSREASWANIRDKVCVGALDGAHMLAGIPIATTLGLGFTRKSMITAFSMDLNGNAITASNALYERLINIDNSVIFDPKHSAYALKQVIDMDKSAGKAPLTFAMVYPFSNHNYEIRYWMAAAGIDPDQDVRLVVIPPQYMAENLKVGQIDGFCAGEPWNSYAVQDNAGRILITGYDIWNNSPEKVFGVTSEWAEKYPDTHLALIRSLLKSAAWIDKPENRNEVSEILSDEKYIGISQNIISRSMAGDFQYTNNGQPVSVPDFNVFHRYQANYPWCSHAAWIITQMYRWGQLDQCIDIRKTAEAVYRPDIYREAAAQIGIKFPSVIYKTEGEHRNTWPMQVQDQIFDLGADCFLDGQNFNPEKILDYLSGFRIKNMKLAISDLEKMNH